MTRGYFAIGIIGGKTPENTGMLWRTASLYEAAFVFTVGCRYQRIHATDTPRTPFHTPLFHYDDYDDLRAHMPWQSSLVAVEQVTVDVIGPEKVSAPLAGFDHPERAVYLLGAEDRGVPMEVLWRAPHIIEIESVVPRSMNVAVAGSIVLHDRHAKTLARSKAA